MTTNNHGHVPKARNKNYEEISSEPAHIRRNIKLYMDFEQAKINLMNMCTFAMLVGTCIGGIYGLIWLVREAFGG